MTIQIDCEVIATGEVYSGHVEKVLATMQGHLRLSKPAAQLLLERSTIDNPIECNGERFWVAENKKPFYISPSTNGY